MEDEPWWVGVGRRWRWMLVEVVPLVIGLARWVPLVVVAGGLFVVVCERVAFSWRLRPQVRGWRLTIDTRQYGNAPTNVVLVLGTARPLTTARLCLRVRTGGRDHDWTTDDRRSSSGKVRFPTDYRSSGLGWPLAPGRYPVEAWALSTTDGERDLLLARGGFTVRPDHSVVVPRRFR